MERDREKPKVYEGCRQQIFLSGPKISHEDVGQADDGLHREVQGGHS